MNNPVFPETNGSTELQSHLFADMELVTKGTRGTSMGKILSKVLVSCYVFDVEYLRKQCHEQQKSNKSMRSWIVDVDVCHPRCVR